MLSATEHLPEQIETPRLVIRVAKPGDGAVFNQAILDSLPQLSPWLGWVTPAPTQEASEQSCRKAYARFLMNEDLMAFFFLKKTPGRPKFSDAPLGGRDGHGPDLGGIYDGGTLVGGSGLHNADWHRRCFEVGCWGRSGWGGQGLITEGVRALAEHAQHTLKANRVFLTADDANVQSWRLAERAGFVWEGTLRNERFNLQGELRHTRVYAWPVGISQTDGFEGQYVRQRE